MTGLIDARNGQVWLLVVSSRQVLSRIVRYGHLWSLKVRRGENRLDESSIPGIFDREANAVGHFQNRVAM